MCVSKLPRQGQDGEPTNEARTPQMFRGVCAYPGDLVKKKILSQ